MTAVLSAVQQQQAERIMNAHNLRSAFLNLRQCTGFQLVQTNHDDCMESYKLTLGDVVVHDELNFCNTCKRSLVDTTHCDGCDEDEERSFYES